MTIYLYGPSGSGKSTAGRLLAQGLALPFHDLDQEIEIQAGKSIPEIFKEGGEAGFRLLEKAGLQRLLEAGEAVVALGGGALLDEAVRRQVEASGQVVCLNASLPVLLERLQESEGARRPLLDGDTGRRLEALLARRSEHYASFPLGLDTTGLGPEQAAWQVQVLLGRFFIGNMGAGCSVWVKPGGLDELGGKLRAVGLKGPIAVVSDEKVAALYAGRLLASLSENSYESQLVLLPAGEQHKTIENVAKLWQAFLSAGLERGSTVVALGGGVVSDLAGFAAATFLRGLPWVVVPTTLLAMVDASLGGKTGADLPQGKNLVGAFHAPRLVLADPQLLGTLPAVELRCGLAEVVKHAMIGDAGLFESFCAGFDLGRLDWQGLLGRSMSVKIQIIQEDPLEKGRRAVLNFGHTIGHAVETASGLAIRHGEAVAIGMVAETRLAETLGLAEAGLSLRLAGVLQAMGLPTAIPPALDPERLITVLKLDKKRQAGVVRFALPVRPGEVRYGIEVEEAALCDLFSSCTGQT